MGGGGKRRGRIQVNKNILVRLSPLSVLEVLCILIVNFFVCLLKYFLICTQPDLHGILFYFRCVLCF